MIGQRVAVALPQPDFGLVPEPGLLGFAVGHREDRHEGAIALVEAGLATLGDLERRVAGLRIVAEQRPHLVRGLQVVAGAVELEAVRVADPRAGRDAQQDVLGFGVLGMHVVQVVGGDQRRADLLGQPEQIGAHLRLDRQAVIHQFDVEVLLAEDRLELAGRGHRLVEHAEPQIGLHLTRRAATGGDQAVVVLVQQFPIGARLVELALETGPR